MKTYWDIVELPKEVCGMIPMDLLGFPDWRRWIFVVFFFSLVSDFVVLELVYFFFLYLGWFLCLSFKAQIF